MIINDFFNKGSITALLFISIFSGIPETYAKSKSISHDNLDIKIGQAIFEKLWVFAPSSTKSSDGLGPLYNARSCLQCHDLSKKDQSNVPFSLVVHLSIEPSSDLIYQNAKTYLQDVGFIPEPTYGKQIQTFAYPGARAEAEISVLFEDIIITFPDGEQHKLSKPKYSITNLGYGDLHPDLRQSPRVAPRMLGLNWLEAIPLQDLLSHADPNDINKDGISGKVNWVWDPVSNSTQLGRFGWKASKANLDQQNLAALSTDIGISSWLFPKAEGDCSELQTHCTQLAKATETHLLNTKHVSLEIALPDTGSNKLAVEASKEMTELLLRFTASLSPEKHLPMDKQELATLDRGQQLFDQIGCQNCHTSQYENIVNSYSNDMESSTISPYTDLLLHDMGTALADKRKEFDASGNEWRTAPLWGISEYLIASPNPHFLHDGRASSALDAILWHGGEAERSKQAFMNLNKEKRTSLINFVESL